MIFRPGLIAKLESLTSSGAGLPFTLRPRSFCLSGFTFVFSYITSFNSFTDNCKESSLMGYSLPLHLITISTFSDIVLGLCKHQELRILHVILTTNPPLVHGVASFTGTELMMD